MANTYTQLYIHYIFAVHDRQCLIKDDWKADLYKYTAGIIEQQGHKLYRINGMPDHVHIFVSMSPNQSPSDLMYHVKRSSSLWINKNHLVTGRFTWQEGFGAFTYGKSQISNLIKYIDEQEIHHRGMNFIDEYKGYLKEYEIDYDERFVFKSIY
ncbi:MAG: IS200/IS605 family transposase [Bacteroidales bacterium]|nr:IS200/IS605 family transposase [Bacteroidales bacterium]